MPRMLGWDAAGEVIATGSDCTLLRKGTLSIMLEHLKHYLRIISRRFRNNYKTFVFRAICVGKNYDCSFTNNDIRLVI
jgi:hypothetical protein